MARRNQNLPLKRVRKSSKPSQRVGCTATLVACKKFSGGKVVVKYTMQHRGHAVNSFHDWQVLWILLGSNKWLQRALAAGLNYSVIKNSTCPDEQTLSVLEAVDLPRIEKVEISELARNSKNDFNYFRRRHLRDLAQLSSDCLVSLRGCAPNIKRDGGIVVVGNFGNRITEEKIDF